VSQRVVFDTNTWISGLLWRGKPYQCLLLARPKIVQAMYCEPMVGELSEKLLAVALPVGVAALGALIGVQPQERKGRGPPSRPPGCGSAGPLAPSNGWGYPRGQDCGHPRRALSHHNERPSRFR
jgi:hypothetical protein